MPADAQAIEVLNERIYRIEIEVDGLKSDFSDHRVAVAKLTEQVASHETRGGERHQQVITAINDLKIDYRAMLQQQSKESSERMALYGKIALGILGILGTIVGGIYGMTPTAKPTATAPAPVSAPASEPSTPVPSRGP